MKYVLYFLILLLSSSVIAQNANNHLIITLGTDTVGIEKYQINKHEIKIEAVYRVNSISKEVVNIDYREDGSILQLTAKGYSPLDSLLFDYKMESVADSLVYSQESDGETYNWSRIGRPNLLGQTIPYYATYAKFIETYKSAPDREFEFTAIKREPIDVEKVNENTYKLSIKVARDIIVKMNDAGELEKVSAFGTGYLSFEATRTDEESFNALADQWLKDPETTVFSTISPRIKDTFEIHGVEIILDYSKTSKRGRNIFGGLVAYNKIWRTGANRATHIEFGEKVLFDNIEIPKGTYTIYTIPQPNQWYFLLNKETGQWGTYYDESQEIVRIPMKINSLKEIIEDLEIILEENEDGGQIKIIWDDTEAKVNFRIAND